MVSEKLTLENICGGSIPEVFERSLQTIIANIRDPNADGEVKRTLTFEFTFKPYADRSSAEVSLVVKEKLATLPAVKGALFIMSKGGRLTAHASDPRQEALFRDDPNASAQ
jgi:hypothetical protein